MLAYTAKFNCGLEIILTLHHIHWGTQSNLAKNMRLYVQREQNRSRVAKIVFQFIISALFSSLKQISESF